jgi:protein deglycase
MKRVLILLANGFEEVEAVTPIDFLRRAELDVTVAGVGSLEITGSRGLKVMCDSLVADLDAGTYDAIVLPGGMPGASNIAANADAGKIITTMMKESRLVGAICAAPAVVLEPLGLLKGKRATCYPGFETRFTDVLFSEDRVVVDGNLVTSRGPGTAAEFALMLVSKLAGEDKAAEIKKGTLQPLTH